MTARHGGGPDLAITGAARCGTSYLAAHLATHPDVNPGRVKEPNYFSRHYGRGPQWYEGVFGERTAGRIRMDASTSYTYPQFPDAIGRLVADSPDVYVVYAVRDPIERALSHYSYYRYYFRNESAQDFGAALRDGSFYADVGDYSVWLPRLRQALPEDRLLVVPFPVITASGQDVLATICRALDIPPVDVCEQRVEAHRNNVVEFRTEGIRRAVKMVRRNTVYLRARAIVGPHRVRRVRSLLTREAHLPTFAEAMSSCDVGQVGELERLRVRATESVQAHLVAQDARLGLGWAQQWAASSAGARSIRSSQG